MSAAPTPVAATTRPGPMMRHLAGRPPSSSIRSAWPAFEASCSCAAAAGLFVGLVLSMAPSLMTPPRCGLVDKELLPTYAPVASPPRQPAPEVISSLSVVLRACLPMSELVQEPIHH